MLHLLKIEWLKLKNYRTFWILSILFLVSIFGINYIVHQIFLEKGLNNPTANILIGGPPFQFPQVWQSITYISSFLLFIPGLLMIISITNEYSFKTHRQNIIDGISRTQFIMVKMVLSLLLAVLSTIVVFITAFLFGYFEGGTHVSFENVIYIFYFFLQAMSYCGVALVFSLLFKRSGISIGVFFLYAVVLENMLSGIMNKYASPVGYYFPLKSVNSLIPFPFFRTITRTFLYQNNTQYLLIATALYLLFYFIFCKKRFETVDL